MKFGRHRSSHFNPILILPIFSIALLAYTIFRISFNYVQENRQSLNLLCMDNPIKSKLSSKTDIVFMHFKSITPFNIIAIKSLKSTGCQASIVVFLNPANVKHNSDYNEMRKFDVEIVEDINYSYPIENHEKIYLEKHPHTTRVLHVSDTTIFFQKDPFSDIPSDKISFVVEPRSIKSVQDEYYTLQSCFGELTKPIKDNFMISNSLFFGNAAQYLDVLNITLSSIERLNCHTENNFKFHLNYLLWTEAFKVKNINYTFIGCEGGFTNIHWCLTDQKVDINDKGQVLTSSGFVPSGVQQFNEIRLLSDYLFAACKIQKPGKKHKKQPKVEQK
ncbi:hypothetical protein TVAG_430970 [Trichomonas vaginalis G3]|uniref:Uncharacterized protein n=1 Tax=Trichomonas vaginalis (strain ATCC PRA-98 / G3) TaxID=412133 RepID=A2EZD5_TRIV3|nr:hypothetical protein TVAGG3_0587990 [Trichomonas vaginalis G3]EAY01956.1 hypothetical protein TVAG_430970 [Trichomonas vaginalis G3]KAI5523038.1 hypothetical protein TVAGG3_0587990 [Trichomonas vaginalis G3]|eukprot:XP_001314466.1 hypothetical protein [Trichomonas vaginalis G3]